MTTATATIDMLDPVSPRKERRSNNGADRLRSLENARIGLLFNSKPGGEHILAGVKKAIAADYPTVEFQERGKPYASVGADFLDELPGEWDAAVIALGDCGSCSSYAIRDGIDLEKLGIPSVVFVSEPFRAISRLWADNNEVPDLGVIVVSHPLAHLPSEVIVEEFGAANAKEVVALLTTGEGDHL